MSWTYSLAFPAVPLIPGKLERDKAEYRAEVVVAIAKLSYYA